MPPKLRVFASPSHRVAALAALVIALPPLLAVTWLPFLDLVAYTGLGAFPARLSAGPFHYATFQLTYIVHYALTRLMADLGIPLPVQIKLLYLLQAGVFFTVTWRCLERFVAAPGIRCVAVAVGALAFCDGLFVWGGPLAFSLAATALAGATWLTIENAGERDRTSGRVALLAALSVVCHPFALPFAVLLGALRWLWVPGARARTAAWVGAICVLGWAIRNDSVEGLTLGELGSMITFEPAEMARRVTELFVVDRRILVELFGAAPWGFGVYLTVLGAIRFAGIVSAPVVAVLAKDAPRLRLLMTLDAILALLYVTSANRIPSLPWWPQRILTFHSCFVFVAGIAGPLYLYARWRRGASAAPETPHVSRAAGIGSMVILVLLAWAQLPLLHHGRAIAASLERSRASLLRGVGGGAFVRVSNLDAVQPFYLRCTPFLLFSDPAIVARNVIVFTEWHAQPRHPTHLVEQWFDLGRPRFRAQFFMANGVLDLKLEPVAEGTFPVPSGMWHGVAISSAADQVANLEGRLGLDLLAAGATRDAIEHFQTAVRANPGLPRLHHDLAMALSAAGRNAEAIDQFGAAIVRNPGFVESHVNRGILLFKAGRKSEALEDFSIAARLNPGDAKANFFLGFLQAEKGAFPEAVAYYQKALATDPRFFEAEMGLATIYWQNGRRAEAAQHLANALNLRPDNADALALADRIRRG